MTIRPTRAALAAALVLLWPIACLAETERPSWRSGLYGALSVGVSSQRDTGGIADNSFRLGTWRASLGRRWGVKQRLEIEVSGLSSRHVSEFETPLRHSQSFEDRALAASFNIYHTLAQRKRFSLQAGGGIGIERSKQTQKFTYPDIDFTQSWASRHDRFRYNLSLGASYQLAPRVSVQLSYRVDKTTGEHVNRTLNTLNLALSLTASPRKLSPD